MSALLHPLAYPVGLALFSALVALLERLRPWRPAQGFVRPRLGWDLASLVLHGHYTGTALALMAQAWILPHTEALWTHLGVPRGLVSGWSLAVQLPLALLLIDLVQWWVHRALHAFAPLWELHKIHHSIEAGEMDWLGSFRFHWMESVIYKSALYLPLGLLGFRAEVLMAHALVGTLVGHLNHANLDLGHGPWRYVLNSPRMHLWHHADQAGSCNYGIIFSAWDWLFGTARVPAEPPARLGFDTMASLPRSLPMQWLWPLRLPRGERAPHPPEVTP